MCSRVPACPTATSRGDCAAAIGAAHPKPGAPGVRCSTTTRNCFQRRVVAPAAARQRIPGRRA